MQKPESRLAPLTEEQAKLAQEIRKKWIDPSQYEDMPVAFAVTQALAQIIDAISRNAEPPEILSALEVLKYSYLTLFGDQHMTALDQLLGGREIVRQMMNHKNAKSIVSRIFERIGPISPGMVIPTTEIADILRDEGFSA